MRFNKSMGLSQRVNEAVPPSNSPETNVAMIDDRVRLMPDREFTTIEGRWLERVHPSRQKSKIEADLVLELCSTVMIMAVGDAAAATGGITATN